MDIRPPKNYKPQPPVSSVPPQPVETPEPLLPPVSTGSPTNRGLLLEESNVKKKRVSRKAVVWGSIVGGVCLAVVLAVVYVLWLLSPREATLAKHAVTIDSGQSPGSIGRLLEQRQIVRSAVAFEWYTRLSGDSSKLKAGRYVLSSSESVQQIVGHIVKGDSDTYNITILPGMTLKELADPKKDGSLADQGFTSSEIERALGAQQYASKLLHDRPAGASLEGYIFPETYQVRSSDTLETLFERTFDELYARLERDGMIQKFQAHGLTLHQALTLASIVQKEVGDPAVQPQVAQVFLKRLGGGIQLGSDVTFIYAAEQAGVTPSVDYDSPYNTRKYGGLPPGPIANMNYSALQAVATPSPGEYLYFVAGDDGKTYFSLTEQEHQSMIDQHCHRLCDMY